MKNIYVCGPTVYSEPHIGNMRPILVFDVFVRALMMQGIQVNFIHNITDIDDKIIKKAMDENVSESTISSRYHKKYLDLLNQLNVKTISNMPTVTEHMNEIISFIESLVNLKKAYVVNGNVYFDVLATDGYGKLSNRKLEEMQYEEGEFKKHPADFALWKNTSIGVKFDSPWGEGRPGWHTECVVFINKYLNGKPLDIHGGGIDLLFPHHENENIQYKALFNNEIANEWKHVGHLNYEGEKMSKSLGNLITTSEFISKYGVDTLRHIFLTTSYSSPIDLTPEIITSSSEQVEKYIRIFRKAQLVLSSSESISHNVLEISMNISAWNLSLAMKNANEIIKNFNKEASETNASNVISLFKLFGFSFTNDVVSEEIKEIYNQWNKARIEKNFALSDELRKKLTEQKIF